VFLQLIWHSTLFVSAVRYPNEIVEPPVVSCEPDQILIKVKTSLTNPSRIYVEDLSGDEQCRTENLNHIGIPLGKCGMQLKKSDSPSGISYRVCFTVQLHPFFATERDASYCAQCNYMETREEVIDTYLQDLSQLKCKYEIRRGSVDGPPVHYAVLGEVVYHTWQCNDDDTGLLVQNCYVENGDGTRILVIDNNGYGLISTPLPESLFYFQETRVFKFADQTVTKFTCQIRLCKKSNGDCDSITVINDPKSSLLSPNPDIYPQMDVVGMLTVLDSPDDVEFFGKFKTGIN
uniref:ZP domain-containing protein n=1 Tax=Syphacia muris TaxID=451379 RepID=A0A0N5AFH6_9BILA